MDKQSPYSLDTVERLTEQIYATATGEGSWRETLVKLAQSFGATRGLLHISGDTIFVPKALHVVGEYKVNPEVYYQSELCWKDPRNLLIAQVPVGQIYYDHMLYDMAEMERDDIYRLNTDVVGVKYSLGVRIALPNGTAATLAVLTDEKQGHASKSDIDIFQRLVPHIERALSIDFFAEVHALTRDALLDAVARKADGVVLLDDAGSPTFVNDQAVAIFQMQDGLGLADGRMIASRSSEAKTLTRLIAQATCPPFNGHSGCGGQMLINRPSRKPPFLLDISPAPKTDRFLTARRIAVVVQISDTGTCQHISKSRICKLFGLSDREGDLAVELVQINELAAAAHAAGMALNTARNHLHSMFHKLDVHHQADLIRILSRAK